MASPVGPRPAHFLYIFYDCEATGLDVDCDRIIEIAAVVPKRDISEATTSSSGVETFQSLCYSERDICPAASEITGLTNRDLRHEPRLPVVLQRFLDWVSERVDRAKRERGVLCTPVLVAHGGFRLDFPMLMAEVERLGGGHSTVFSHHMYQKIAAMNLHFGDTYTTCKQLAKKTASVMAGIEKKGLDSIYRAFFHESYSAHRALGDAQALHRLFTESPLKAHLRELIMKSPQEAYTHWKAVQLTQAGIAFGKAKRLAQSREYLEKMLQRYNESPARFQFYLRSLGIRNLSPELTEYFETHGH